MDKIRDAVRLLYPGQVPVIYSRSADICYCQIEWQWPKDYGENKFLLMFGGLHLEMTLERSLSSLLQDSGWTAALIEAGVTSSATVDSFLSAASVTKTCQSHQVTACTLYKLLQSAYFAYCTDVDEGVDPTGTRGFEDWCKHRKLHSPQFWYWHLVLTQKLSILLFIRFLIESNFSLYDQALCQMILYMYANNNLNYARWLPVHLIDMMTLVERHPQTAEAFHARKFVVHKSDRYSQQ